MMGQTTEPNINIEEVLRSSHYFYTDLLGYTVNETSLTSIPDTEWGQYTQARGLNPNSEGVYLPRSQEAIMKADNPLSLFHEYFGHGLYFEHTGAGNGIIQLEQELLSEEANEFEGRRFTSEDLELFRKSSATYDKLIREKDNSLENFELFAVWTEKLLDIKYGSNGTDWADKYQGQELLHEKVGMIDECSKRNGLLYTLYDSGLRRNTTPTQVNRLIDDIYKDSKKDIVFAILYGSKQEFSDIDVLMVSKGIGGIETNCLDISAYTPESFEKGIEMFDVSLTDPLVSGEFLFGDQDYYNRMKESLKTQEITKEAIEYNRSRSEEQSFVATQWRDNPKRYAIGLGYGQTFSRMSIELSNGRRLLTKKELLSEDERSYLHELKGGKINHEIRNNCK
jgi:hypothetical protein